MAGFNSELTGAQVKAGIEKGNMQPTHVSEFGAVGDGVTDDTAAIRAARNSVPWNGVLEFSPGATYLISDEIRMAAKPITMVGNGATLKRADAQQTTLASAAASGTTTIEVSDASSIGLAVGSQVLLVDTNAPNGGKATDEVSGPHYILAISGNTLTVERPVEIPPSKSGDADWTVGSVVLKVYPMVQQNEGSKISIYNMRFDGNRANNTVHQSWTVNHCISRVGRGSVVDGCEFFNMPNECMFLGHWCTITNCTAYDLNGSFTHTSSAVGAAGDPGGAVILSNNRITRAGEIGPIINNHSEGAFTWSSQPGKVVVQGNIVENCVQGFTGSMNNNGEIIISGNLVKNVNGILQITRFGTYWKSVSIHGNIFDTCLWLVLNNAGSGPNEDLGIEGISIQGNEFLNTRIFINEASHVNIIGNQIIWKDDFDPTAVTPKHLNGSSTLVSLQRCVNLNLQNNIIEDQKLTFNEINQAVSMNIADGLLKAPDTGSGYHYYGRNVRVSGNQIINFINGISHLSAQGQGAWGAVLNYVVSGNTIVLRDSAVNPGDVPSNNDRAGIRGYPGMIIQGNTILCAPTTQFGIKLMAVNLGAKDNINGEIVVGNTVLGNPDHSIQVGMGLGTSNKEDNSWNVTCVNNITNKAVEDNNPTQNIVQGNVQLPVTNQGYEIQPARANPDWY